MYIIYLIKLGPHSERNHLKKHFFFQVNREQNRRKLKALQLSGKIPAQGAGGPSSILGNAPKTITFHLASQHSGYCACLVSRRSGVRSSLRPCCGNVLSNPVWCSGNISDSHSGARGSIPRTGKVFFFFNKCFIYIHDLD